MTTRLSLRQAFAEQTREFSAALPGISDGSADAVHDARVAVRRMRAACPFLTSRGDREKRWASELRTIGKALGRVRDHDVAVGLLRQYEERIPVLAPVALTLRRSLALSRWPPRRDLLKHLESREISSLLGEFDRVSLGSAAWPLWTPRSTTERLRVHMGAHASGLAGAIGRAAGVYFPNRLHRVRIEAKKLRYVLEMAVRVCMWPDDRDVRTLRRAQNLLGDMRDRQLLTDLLEEAQGQTSTADEGAFASVLAAERDEFHGRYAARRVELLEVCTAIQRFAARTVLSPFGLVRPALACGAVALPAAAWLLLRHPRAARLGTG